MQYSDLTSELLLSRFPELNSQITSALELDEGLPHCLFANVLNPVLRGYFGEHDFSGAKTRRMQKSALKSVEPLILRIFEFYEELAVSEDEEVRNLLQVSLLEPLYDNKQTYAGALLFMGDKTRALFDEVAGYLNKPQ